MLPIITSASFFIEILKKQLVKDKQMLPDEIFDGIEETLLKLVIEHDKTTRLGFLKHPDSMYSLLYQDGLQHAFQHILSNRNSGRYTLILQEY